MKKSFAFSVVLAWLAAALGMAVASAQQPVTVNVTLGQPNEFSLVMSQTTLPANTPVKFVIVNNGKLEHEVVLEKAGAVDQALDLNGHDAEAGEIQPGETRTVEWTIPQAGDYQLGCHVTGHYENGMVEKFTATAAGAAQVSSGATPTAATGQAPAAGATAVTANATPEAGATTSAAANATPAATSQAPNQLPVTGGNPGQPVAWLAAGVALMLLAAAFLVRRQAS